MSVADRRAFLVTPLVVLVGVGLAFAGSQHGTSVGGLRLFGLAVAVAFLIQWVVFVPSYLAQTERFFDLTGSLTYISVTIGIGVLTPGLDARGFFLGAMVVIWAARLGPFLFRRVSRSGKDDRFDEIKPSLPRFLSLWTIQGLWVSFTAAAAWIAMSSEKRVPLEWVAIVGLVVWAIGFGIEVIADWQKTRFRADPQNRGRFITTGLWSRSRHPNYFGEILLWVGVAVVALPVFQGWQWVGLISPLFVALLIIRVSGVPMLEAKAESTWGGQADYEAYKKNTPALIPRLI